MGIVTQFQFLIQSFTDEMLIFWWTPRCQISGSF